MTRRHRLRRRDRHQPPTLESVQAELKGLRVALLALGLAIVGVGVVVAVLLFGRAPRQAYVNNQLHTLTCLAVQRLPDTHPTARDLRAAYHCPPYSPPPSGHHRAASSKPPPAAASAPAAATRRPDASSSIETRRVVSSGRATRRLEASTATVGRDHDTPTRTVTVTPSTVTASPSGPIAPLCSLAADLRIC